MSHLGIETEVFAIGNLVEAKNTQTPTLEEDSAYFQTLLANLRSFPVPRDMYIVTENRIVFKHPVQVSLAQVVVGDTRTSTFTMTYLNDYGATIIASRSGVIGNVFDDQQVQFPDNPPPGPGNDLFTEDDMGDFVKEIIDIKIDNPIPGVTSVLILTGKAVTNWIPIDVSNIDGSISHIIRGEQFIFPFVSDIEFTLELTNSNLNELSKVAGGGNPIILQHDDMNARNVRLTTADVPPGPHIPHPFDPSRTQNGTESIWANNLMFPVSFMRVRIINRAYFPRSGTGADDGKVTLQII